MRGEVILLRENILAPHLKLANGFGARGLGGALTFHCYFLTNIGSNCETVEHLTFKGTLNEGGALRWDGALRWGWARQGARMGSNIFTTTFHLLPTMVSRGGRSLKLSKNGKNSLVHHFNFT